jgi:hypothetical protein
MISNFAAFLGYAVDRFLLLYSTYVSQISINNKQVWRNYKFSLLSTEHSNKLIK